MLKRTVVVLVLAVLGVASAFAVAGSQKGEESLSGLLEGNKRFISGRTSQKSDCEVKRKELLSGQQPAAIVVACSDSRVAPEVVFDQFLGDIFVVRVAGNVLDTVALGSIEYAAEHLHTPLLVIMGHEKCGAVVATIEAAGESEGNIGAIVAKILPAAEKAKAKGGSKEDVLNNAIRENVLLSHATVVKNSPVLKHLMETGKLKVVDAVYHMNTGAVEILAQSTPLAAAMQAH